MAENSEMNQLLTFSSGEDIFGFDIKSVQDIIEIPDITPLPMVAEYICGIMNLRGKAVPVMDFAGRMGFEPAAYDKHSCVVVIDCDGSPLGVKVEKVIDAELYQSDRLIPSPVERSCIKGYLETDEKRIAVIDCIIFSEKNK